MVLRKCLSMYMTEYDYIMYAIGVIKAAYTVSMRLTYNSDMYRQYVIDM